MAISRAASTGVRNEVTKTLGPNFRRVVRAAMAAIAVMGSGIGSGEARRSENHNESISLFSHSSTKRQKKSRPAEPDGHGPGMTPTRYLIGMAGLYHGTGSFDGAGTGGHAVAREAGRQTRRPASAAHHGVPKPHRRLTLPTGL